MAQIPMSILKSQVAVTDGSVTTPSVSFSNDTNTGLYRPDADSVAIVTGGVERMRVDAAGNVNVLGSLSVNNYITSPYFKLYAIAENVPFNNASSWTRNVPIAFPANPGRALLLNSFSGFVNPGGLYTWTLDYSTNNGSTYTTLRTFSQYFNTTTDHEHQSSTNVWNPPSNTTVTHWRLSFNGAIDANDFWDFHILMLPFT